MNGIDVAQAHRIRVQRERDAVDAVDCTTARAHYLRGAFEASEAIEHELRVAAGKERRAVELARFPIVGGTEDRDAVAVVVRPGASLLSDGQDGFEAWEIRRDGSEVACIWNIAAAPVVTYAAQLAGWPVKYVADWSEIGHPDYWPGAVEGSVAQRV